MYWANFKCNNQTGFIRAIKYNNFKKAKDEIINSLKENMFQEQGNVGECFITDDKGKLIWYQKIKYSNGKFHIIHNTNNRSIKIAKQLIKLAKSLVAESNIADHEGEYENFTGIVDYNDTFVKVQNAHIIIDAKPASFKVSDILIENGTILNGKSNGVYFKNCVFNGGQYENGWIENSKLQGNVKYKSCRCFDCSATNGDFDWRCEWHGGDFNGGTWDGGAWREGNWISGFNGKHKKMSKSPDNW